MKSVGFPSWEVNYAVLGCLFPHHRVDRWSPGVSWGGGYGDLYCLCSVYHLRHLRHHQFHPGEKTLYRSLKFGWLEGGSKLVNSNATSSSERVDCFQVCRLNVTWNSIWREC